MPNHFHGIVWIQSGDRDADGYRANPVGVRVEQRGFLTAGRDRCRRWWRGSSQQRSNRLIKREMRREPQFFSAIITSILLAMKQR